MVDGSDHQPAADPGARRSALILALLTTGLIATSLYMVRPLVAYKAVALGANPFELALVASAYATLPALVAVTIGRRVDSQGSSRFVVAGTVLGAASCLWIGQLTTLPQLIVAYALIGLAQILTMVALQTLVAELGTGERRDAYFGVMAIVVSVGEIAGPALAGWIAGASSEAGAGPFLVGAALLLAATMVATQQRRKVTPAIMTGSPDEDGSDGDEPTPTLRQIIGQPGMGTALLSSLAVLASIDVLITYLPAYGEEAGISIGMVGLLLSTRAAASMASRLLMLPLSRWLGRLRLLGLGLALPAVGYILIPWSPHTWVLFLAMIAIGVGLGVGQPLTIALVAAKFPGSVRGTALGVRLTANRIGQIATPMVAGAIAVQVGLGAIFWMTAAGLAGAARMSFKGRTTTPERLPAPSSGAGPTQEPT